MRGDVCRYCSAEMRPALEHDRGCKIRVEFYGGDASWRTTEDHYGPDGTRYSWNNDLGTWMPVFEPFPLPERN